MIVSTEVEEDYKLLAALMAKVTENGINVKGNAVSARAGVTVKGNSVSARAGYTIQYYRL